MLHHDEGKAPATISQVVASVSWRSKQAGQQIVGEITLATMAGIRREGAGRGTGQVDGLTWEQVDIVVSLCLNERTIRGLRDASLIRLMSDCLLRVGEAVAVNCGDLQQRTLRIRKSPRPIKRAKAYRSMSVKIRGRSSLAIERRARSNVAHYSGGYERATMLRAGD